MRLAVSVPAGSSRAVDRTPHAARNRSLFRAPPKAHELTIRSRERARSGQPAGPVVTPHRRTVVIQAAGLERLAVRNPAAVRQYPTEQSNLALQGPQRLGDLDRDARAFPQRRSDSERAQTQGYGRLALALARGSSATSALPCLGPRPSPPAAGCSNASACEQAMATRRTLNTAAKITSRSRQERRLRCEAAFTLCSLALAATEPRKNVFGEMLLDLAMARYRLVNTSGKIAVPIVLGTVSNEHAAGLSNSADQRGSFHATAMSATLRIPRSSSLVRST